MLSFNGTTYRYSERGQDRTDFQFWPRYAELMDFILGRWLVAASYTACADCGEDIKPGDIIRNDDTGRYVCGYLCEDCGTRAEG